MFQTYETTHSSLTTFQLKKSLAKDHIVSQSAPPSHIHFFCNHGGEGGNNNAEASKRDLRN